MAGKGAESSFWTMGSQMRSKEIWESQNVNWSTKEYSEKEYEQLESRAGL